MNTTSRTTSRNAGPVRLAMLIGATYGATYGAAMAILVLSQIGVISSQAWLYGGMALGLFSALSGFGLGYALAVTSEARNAKRPSSTSRPATPLPRSRPHAVSN